MNPIDKKTIKLTVDTSCDIDINKALKVLKEYIKGSKEFNGWNFEAWEEEEAREKENERSC